MQLVFILLGFLLSTGDYPNSYKGEVELPFDLYTKDHVLVSAGHCSLEVRYQNAAYSLILSHRNKAEALTEVIGGRMERPKFSESHYTIPIVGTILMRASTIVVKQSVEISPPRIAPALPRLDWKATLRLYKSSDPSENEILLLFETQSTSQKRDLVGFRLSLKP